MLRELEPLFNAIYPTLIKNIKVEGLRYVTVYLQHPPLAYWSLGLAVADFSLSSAYGTGVRCRTVPSSASPGLTLGTQIPLSLCKQWRSRSLLKHPTENTNDLGGDRTHNVMSMN